MPEPHRQPAFLGVSAGVFAASTVATITWCRAMAGMGEIPMPGAFQFTASKRHHLACCRQVPRPGFVFSTGAASAWQHGWRCCRSCAGLTAILLVMGVMNLGAMLVITAAITAERLAPAGQRVAHAIGALSVGAGLLLTAQAAWPG